MRYVIVAFLLVAWPAHATLVDITDPALQHFGDFPNVNYPGDYSKISGDFVTDPNSRDFGWHFSPASGLSISGIILDQSHTVTSLTFQVHSSPFKDFLLQGSMGHNRWLRRRLDHAFIIHGDDPCRAGNPDVELQQQQFVLRLQNQRA